jgi:hypothetical protein
LVPPRELTGVVPVVRKECDNIQEPALRDLVNKFTAEGALAAMAKLVTHSETARTGYRETAAQVDASRF